MAYRNDPDLEFLSKCSNEDLGVLVDILTKNKEGNSRFTQELTLNEEYKNNFPNHSVYWKLIAAELQCFAASTFATWIRGGEGVLYKEALVDVCNRMKVNFNSDADVELIERNLLMKILTDSLDQMDTEAMKELVADLKLNTANLNKQAVAAALQAAVAFGGFAAYRIAVIVANSVAKLVIGRGLAFAANAGIARVLNIFSGPVGWALTAAWTLVDVAGPAYRVTIPAVIQVAYMRAKLKHGG